MSESDRLITNRPEFAAALRTALAEAAAAGSRALWLCDEDFAEWPLGERSVIDDLTRWAATHRKLTLVARHYDELARRHPRWVEWRRTWSHIVVCRSNVEIATGDFPAVLLAQGAVWVRLSDRVQSRGRLARDAAGAVRCTEIIKAMMDRSEDAFAASTTGL